MTLTLTSITKKQWNQIGTVAIWVIVTNGIGILTAWISKQPDFLAIGPALNVLGVTIQKVGQIESDQAEENLRTTLQPQPGDIVPPNNLPPQNIPVTDSPATVDPPMSTVSPPDSSTP